VTSTSLPTLEQQAQGRNASYAIGLLLQIAVFNSLIGVGSATIDDGSLSRQLLWGCLGLVSIGYLLISAIFYKERQFNFGGWPVALLLAYIFASTLWSTTPVTTVKRATVLLFLIAVCGVSLGTSLKNWRDDLFTTLLAGPLAVLVLLSVALTLAMPSMAFTDIGWRGVATHKNEAGQMMAFVVLLLFYGKCHAKLGLRMRAALIVLCAALLLLAESTTAMLGAVVGIALTEVCLFRANSRKLGSWRVPVLSVLLFVAALLFFMFLLDLLPSANELYVKLLTGMGKSETFTGRTAIWELVIGESRFHNPWLGGGYGGFWVGRNSISGYVIIGDDLYPGQSHNGYLDIYNDLGIVGLGLLATLVLVSLYRTGQLLALGHAEGRIHLAIAFLCIFNNLGESTYLRGTNFLNIIFVASFVRTACILKQARARPDPVSSTGPGDDGPRPMHTVAR
jgi:exopolysaccharide production protein ExoQ